MTPLALALAQLRLAHATFRLTASAATTIAYRIWGPIFTSPAEAMRMWVEKPPALLAAGAAFWKAAGAGREPFGPAIRPLLGPAERNARRLGRRR